MQTYIFVPRSKEDVDCHRITTGGSRLASTEVDDILVLGVYVLLLKLLKSPEVDLAVAPNYLRVLAGRGRAQMAHPWDSRSQGLRILSVTRKELSRYLRLYDPSAFL
jgi:hypothetical protein